MIFFLVIVFPGLCLFSLMIGMIYFYRGITDYSKEEASEAKKDIIYVGVCCALVFLCFLTLFLTTNSTTEPIEPPDDGSELILNFILGGGFTLMLMVVMFGIGVSIGGFMSIDLLFGNFWIRWIIRFLICILFMFLAAALMGWWLERGTLPHLDALYAAQCIMPSSPSRSKRTPHQKSNTYNNKIPHTML